MLRDEIMKNNKVMKDDDKFKQHMSTIKSEIDIKRQQSSTNYKKPYDTRQLIVNLWSVLVTAAILLSSTVVIIFALFWINYLYNQLESKENERIEVQKQAKIAEEMRKIELQRVNEKLSKLEGYHDSGKP